ncbi:MAG: 2-succinyl-6-hydroxy-2,4-cyclohexadiene-1-carboxylate synthase [Alphaproteobacteria bacterium MarineAlpha2_Bin1]|nr:MAG: 2-succinyl-6-hydroxy-2,4-cyclohexadiene-1-carboxylate synthase [Alphaproteobacteria bacterium MarineAlpha2_Bin1]
MKEEIFRRFININGRIVHYWISGKGRPLVLLHASPQDGSFVLEPLHGLAKDFQMIALDTPGYGLSEPLKKNNPTAKDFANATIDTLKKLNLNKCILYGTHTGAHIALEVAINSNIIKCLIIDGISFYNTAEKKTLLKKYAPKFISRINGDHLIRAWHHTRDQTIFYPWFNKKNRIRRKLPHPNFLHNIVISKLRAEENYIKGYKAAFSHNTHLAFKKVKISTLLYSRSDDVLEKHVNRISFFNPNIKLIKVSNKHQLIKNITKNCKKIKLNSNNIKINQPPSASFIDINNSQQLIRIYGKDDNKPVIILHGIGKNSLSTIKLQKELSINRKVISFDIPGNGFSDIITYKNKISSYSKNLILILNKLKLKKVSIISFDASISLAINALTLYPLMFDAVILINPILLNSKQKKDFSNNFFPNIKPNKNGTQLIVAWNYLRDSELFWPWFRTGEANIKDLTTYKDPKAIQHDFIQIMTASKTYQYYAKACFSYNQDTINKKIYAKTLLLQNKINKFDKNRNNISKIFENSNKIEMPKSQKNLVSYINKFLDKDISMQ